jgi:membrane protease YdiL (CAAX protease family)
MQEKEGTQDMKRTWMPRAAGILCIIAGVLILVIIGWVVDLNVGGPSHEGGYGVIFLALFFAPISILLIILGIFAIVGGIYALKRRRWGLALAGSICVLIPGIALGGIGALFASALSSVVLAFVVFAGLALLPLIFVILGKREFK